MKKFFILLSLISISLVGCSEGQNSQTVTTSRSLHNYDLEMITAALKYHPDFPKLNANESKTEEIVNRENSYLLTYKSKTEVHSHGPTVTTDPHDENSEVWVEESSADYYITLIKEWESDEGIVKSYWTYKYIPQSNELELVESENNDYLINTTTQNMSKEMPSDFDFSIRFGVQKKNEINTFEGTVTKDLIMDGTAKSEFTFTEEEMIDIYEKMLEIHITGIKEFIPESKDGLVCVQEPYGDDEWVIRMNGETITHSISGKYCEPTNDAKQLIKLRKYVLNLIKNKDAYQSLPDSRGGYE